MSFLASPLRLRRLGVLGMNQRNADFIMRYNPRRLYPLVDNKLLTKELAIQHGIAVPALYAVVREQHEAVVPEVGHLGGDARRVVALDQRVVVGQEVEALHAGQAAGAHRGADGADVVAQVGRARGGDAGEDAFHGVFQLRSGPAAAGDPRP